MTQPAQVDASLVATREETDASLAEERGKTDALLDRAAPAAGSVAHAAAGEAVSAERAETDETLLAERNEVDQVVDETRGLLAQEQREAGASKVALGRRDEFLAMVSHDLRNPLAVIAMNADLIVRSTLDEPNTADIKTLAAEIIASSDQMRRMVGDLLDLTAMETGALKLNSTRGDVMTVILETVASLTPGSGEIGPSLSVETPAEPLLARFDPDRIWQVLVNLVGNALRFTAPSGSVAVWAAPLGHEALVCVEDTGVGIPEADLPHVFERFWQVGKNDRRGLGLGLYICRGIVEAHHGRIWVSSVVGRGSKFAFTLPLD
jgi:signal transduction histidine kinase